VCISVSIVLWCVEELQEKCVFFLVCFAAASCDIHATTQRKKGEEKDSCHILCLCI